MADVGKVYPSELHLVRKELEAHGEMLSRERLEREAETNRLKVEITALKRYLETQYPDFSASYSKLYEAELLKQESFEESKVAS